MLSRLLFPLLLLLTVLASACVIGPSRVAIMDFDVAAESPTYDKLKIAIPEYLTLYLANNRGIYLLERQDIHRFLAEIDSDPADTRNLTRWQRLGQKLQAEYLIAGSCSRLDQNFVITARLFNVGTGEIEPNTAIAKTCVRESEILDRSKALAAELIWLLRHRAPAQSAQASTGTSMAKPERPYAETVTPLPSVDRTPTPQWQPVR